MNLRCRPVCLLMAALLLFAGCGREPSPPSVSDADRTESLDAASSETTTAYRPAAPVILDELLPVEDYSNEREEAISHVVIHFMSALLTNPSDPYDMESCRGTLLDGGVSTHYIIDREGGIHRLIPEERAAWHAGKGTWQNDGRFTNRMNQYAIGIELLGIGTEEEMRQYISSDRYASLPPEWIGFTDAQYASLDTLLDDILFRYPAIVRDRAHILGHSEYNPAKADPGALFAWDRIGMV